MSHKIKMMIAAASLAVVPATSFAEAFAVAVGFGGNTSLAVPHSTIDVSLLSAAVGVGDSAVASSYTSNNTSSAANAGATEVGASLSSTVNYEESTGNYTSQVLVGAALLPSDVSPRTPLSGPVPSGTSLSGRTPLSGPVPPRP